MVIKMNNISFKIVIIFLICIFLCCSYSLAADTTDDIIGGADNFIKKANTEGTIMQDSSKKAIDLLSFWDNFEFDPDGNKLDFIVSLPKGSIKKLIGRELTWEDEPYEFL